LIVANGIFSLSEIALVSARKARLEARAQRGDRRAQTALDLSNRSTEFLSTVQIGITLIGILTGVFGGATIADHLGKNLNRVAWIAPHGQSVAVTIVVIAITYLTLVIGELVPKRIALANPEGVATLVAPAMTRLSRMASPIVRFLGWSSEGLVKLLRIPPSSEPAVTEEELTSMLELGTQTGEFHPAKEEMIRGVFTLGDPEREHGDDAASGCRVARPHEADRGVAAPDRRDGLLPIPGRRRLARPARRRHRSQGPHGRLFFRQADRHAPRHPRAAGRAREHDRAADPGDVPGEARRLRDRDR
jgi:hypothetical protein